MKHILTSLFLIYFFISPTFSQELHPVYSPEIHRKDTSFWGNTMIKINPLNLLSGILFGEEYGGTLQFPLLKKRIPLGSYYKVDAYIGGGVNQYFEASGPQGGFPLGYTIRGGVYYFFSEKRKGYLSLQYFFRKWYFNNIIDYPTGDNEILDPGSIIGSEGSAPDYRYNATVSVNCYDLVYGNQIPISYSGRVILDWYIGLGRRIKNIQQTIIGDYDNGINYTPRATPFSYPDEIDKYLDIKAGFMIGFIL